jgi:hypothetical protein
LFFNEILCEYLLSNLALDVLEAILIISLLIIFLKKLVIKNNQIELTVMNQLKLQF